MPTIDPRKYITPNDPVIKDLARRFETPVQAFKHVVRSIEYRLERKDVWRLPRETLRLGYGDCEDLSNLLTSILRAMGYPAKSVIYAIRANGKTYYHVATKLGSVVYDPSTKEINPSWLAKATPLLEYDDRNVRVLVRAAQVSANIERLGKALETVGKTALYALPFLVAAVAAKYTYDFVKPANKALAAASGLSAAALAGALTYKYVSKPLAEALGPAVKKPVERVEERPSFEKIESYEKERKREKEVVRIVYVEHHEAQIPLNHVHTLDPFSESKRKSVVVTTIDLVPIELVRKVAKKYGVLTKDVEVLEADILELGIWPWYACVTTDYVCGEGKAWNIDVAVDVGGAYASWPSRTFTDRLKPCLYGWTTVTTPLKARLPQPHWIPGANVHAVPVKTIVMLNRWPRACTTTANLKVLLKTLKLRYRIVYRVTKTVS